MEKRTDYVKTKEILLKAYSKAEQNGFTIKSIFAGFPDDAKVTNIYDMEDYHFDNEGHSMQTGLNTGWSINCYRLLFSHKFAKALWGEEVEYERFGDEEVPVPAWMRHLQLMVLCEDPIEYLESNMRE